MELSKYLFVICVNVKLLVTLLVIFVWRCSELHNWPPTNDCNRFSNWIKKICCPFLMLLFSLHRLPFLYILFLYANIWNLLIYMIAMLCIVVHWRWPSFLCNEMRSCLKDNNQWGTRFTVLWLQVQMTSDDIWLKKYFFHQCFFLMFVPLKCLHPNCRILTLLKFLPDVNIQVNWHEGWNII